MLLLLLALPCASESSVETGSAIGRLGFVVKVPPVFRILRTMQVAGGYEYLVWVNMKSIVLNGREHRFTRVGETTLFVPYLKDALIVHGL